MESVKRVQPPLIASTGRKSSCQALVQLLVPIGGEGTKDPSSTASQSLVGGLQVEDHGDAPTRALQLTAIMRRDGIEAHDTDVKAIRTVGIVFENIGDVVGKASLQRFSRRRAHECHGDRKVATKSGNDREATDLRQSARSQNPATSIPGRSTRRPYARYCSTGGA